MVIILAYNEHIKHRNRAPNQTKGKLHSIAHTAGLPCASTHRFYTRNNIQLYCARCLLIKKNNLNSISWYPTQSIIIFMSAFNSLLSNVNADLSKRIGLHAGLK